MYTELDFNVELKEDVPEDVVAILNAMASPNFKIIDLPTPPHLFFGTRNWEVLFKMDSYYFKAVTRRSFFIDPIGKQWILNVRSNLENYDSEIEKFIDWIMPYVDAEPGEFLGFYRYEETQTPTLIHAR